MLPAWQFTDTTTTPGLGQLLAFNRGKPLSLATWATSPHPDLDGVTPADALRQGRISELLEILQADRGWTESGL